MVSKMRNKSTKLSSAPDMNGSPHTLVVTGAGIRAANLTRALRKFQTEQATVAKLFAKHIKLEEAIAFVKKTRIGIAIGTPTRLINLLDEDHGGVVSIFQVKLTSAATAGVLSLENLQRLVVDCSHIDQKRRGILDMSETQNPLIELLNRQGLKERYAASEKGVDLLFY
ncbi:hypothetical protein FGG08_001952 [Glutinoglossum americanum]|uniref:Uncharacterized protein n=1 Tax=Glutinoglossum americanum TaxID=1670608 RepID=A0A9P8I142_9PEZI|nr:hypothetical protein FGG08_001952 [Glutinoglossum americanum]